MEKWSWIRIRNPISTKIELVLEVHPLLPPTKFGGDPWTRSCDILRTTTVRTDRQTDRHTRRWPQDLAAYGAQVKKIPCGQRGEHKCFTIETYGHGTIETSLNINYCVRGDTNLRAGRGQHRPCRILARCRKKPYPARLTEMEKWSWIRIRNPISSKIELILEVHPLLPPTKFGGDTWTRSWDILRTKKVRADRQTDTRRWPQDLAAYGARVKSYGVICRMNFDIIVQDKKLRYRW